MKALKRVVLGFLVLLLFVAAAGFFYIRHISHRALPDYNKDIPLQGLYAPVEVYRDSFAIPHVYAQNEHDLYMVTGYLLAQDRLWQMDMLRHVTEGRLSELFGKAYLENDLILRSLRFREKSEKILAQADSACISALQAFADGINHYIQRHSNRLPPEFAILRYKPEKWEPYHSLNMIGYMGWDLKAGWSEMILGKIKKAVDSIRYQQLLPDLQRKQPVVFPAESQTAKSTSILPDLMLHMASLQQLGVDVLDGSNNWAVSGTKSSTGLPLLANDMHLGLSVPGIWYQMHQVVNGRLNVTGLVLPGTPMIICGHNDSIAWGMTNTYVDNVDFYEETINPDDSTQYEYNGSWRNFAIVKETINISGGEQVERDIWFSHRGPVVSSFKGIANKVVTMHWVGDEMSDEIRTVYLLNHADDWTDFKEALKSFTSISQNVVYADRKGNIGLFCAAGIPVRKRDISFGVLPGNTDEYDWKGYVPFEKLPYQFNPVSGYVASANNRTVTSDYPYHIGTWYAHPSRFQRITELLAGKEKLTTEDFRRIQLDQHSKMAEQYMPCFMKALATYENMTETESKAYEILREWDYSMDSKSSAALLFESIYRQFIRCTFSDELGNDLFESFNSVGSISRNAADQLITSGISEWFDNQETEDQTESLNDMVICAFTKTISDFESMLGKDPGSWEWGAIHRLTLAHPLSTVNILDKAFHLNRGPFPVGGSFHTVSPYSYSSSKPYDASHGSSHRHIFDVSDWDRSFTVIPTGNSGIPASEHYCDQTELYINGHYHADYFTRDNVMANAKYHMTFLCQDAL